MTDFSKLSDADLLAQYKAAKGTSTPADFAEAYGPAATKAAAKLGVDPQVLLGQWGLETGWGKSIIPGTHNLGNIKDFSGGGTAATDNMTGSRDKYRTYASPDAFADDYSDLISRKYPGAVGAKTPEQFAAALKAGGYAEDPNYAAKVVKASQMAQPKGLIQRGVEAVIPSAQAAEPAQPANPLESMSDDELLAAYQKAKGATSGKRSPTDVEKIIQRVAAVTSPAGGLVDAATGGKMSVGAARGFKDIADTGAELLAKGYDKLTGSGPNVSSLVTGQPSGEYARLKADNEAGKADFASTYGDSTAAKFGRLSGQVAGTYPVGGVLGAPLKAMAPAGTLVNRLGTALATSGATTGAPVAQGLAPAAGNMLLRMFGGAGAGAAGAALIDPNAATTGAVVGAALPPATRLVGALANTAGSLVRPFTSGGQQKIAGNVLRDLATDPVAARAALQDAASVVPGSAPTAVTASGDAGIAALSRTMQNASPEYAANLAARQTAQNQARTAAIEGIAGNTGKLDLAKQARNAATGPMREEALNAAGKVPAQGILQQIDNLIADPSNAGQLSQQALNQFKSRIAANVKDGAVDARALYAIRKDINDVLGGKLQGEAGNLKYAASQLSGVKGFIDDAIDQASRSMPANAIGPTTRGAPNWKGYLQKYANESVPINQMEKLEDILKSIQTGTVDSQGGAIISAAKLNNVLKNKGSELAKDLSAAQLQVLRNIQADLNASQIANNVGRSVGSNTVQNLAQNQLLESAFGRTLGGSTAASSTLGRLLQLPYGAANKQIQERIGNALLNPQEASRLLAEPEGNSLLRAFQNSAVPYKAAPVISAR